MNSEKRRYHLVIPEGLFNEVQAAATARKTTVVSLLRRFIRLGLLALKLESKPGSALVVIEGKRRRRILFTNEDLILVEQSEHEQEKELEVLPP